MASCCAHGAKQPIGEPHETQWPAEWRAEKPEERHTGLDAARYKKEFEEITSEPLTAWRVKHKVRQEGGLWIGERELRGPSPAGKVTPFILSLSTCEYECHNIKALYDFLMSVEGFSVIDPDTKDHAQARKAAYKKFLFDGCPGFVLFNVCELPWPMKPRLVCSESVLHEPSLSLINFSVPFPADAAPAAAARCARKPWCMVYYLQLQQAGPNRVRVRQLFSSDMGTGRWASTINAKYFKDMDKRLQKHLQERKYYA